MLRSACVVVLTAVYTSVSVGKFISPKQLTDCIVWLWIAHDNNEKITIMYLVSLVFLFIDNLDDVNEADLSNRNDIFRSI